MEITALGPGYVGTVAAASLAASGHSVLGIDIDPERIGSLQSGITPFYEPALAETIRLPNGAGNPRFAHSDAPDARPGDVALITNGTPRPPTAGQI